MCLGILRTGWTKTHQAVPAPGPGGLRRSRPTRSVISLLLRMLEGEAIAFGQATDFWTGRSDR